MDETGHKDRGKSLWTWCFRAMLFTLFKISPSRGSDVLVEDMRRLFHTIHRRDEYASEDTLRQALERIANDICWDAFRESPGIREAENIAKRFRLNTDGFFRFITTPGVEPTNNLAEQAIRFVAIHRKITQGTRGATGPTWCERIGTVIGTYAQTGRSVFDFLHSAITAHFTSGTPPTLVLDST